MIEQNKNKRIFNVTGPCVPGDHYLLPAIQRAPEMQKLIEHSYCFVLHAPQQSGKTSLIKALVADINNSGQYIALYCSLRTARNIADPEKGIPAIIKAIQDSAAVTPALRGIPINDLEPTFYTGLIQDVLFNLCSKADKPLILFFDDTDCLVGDTFISFLRQLRAGYNSRERASFPFSFALIGMRDIRDYKASVHNGIITLGCSTPFNIVTKSLTLVNFTRDEIAVLYRQHTADTGQVFEEAAIDRASYWTCGQPWLVNAIARECIETILAMDYTKPVTAELINQAAENLIRRRDTHIDSLLEQLNEERVRSVIEPVITGREKNTSFFSDDTQYVLDLGILKQDRGNLFLANPIYAEVISRALSYDAQIRT